MRRYILDRFTTRAKEKGSIVSSRIDGKRLIERRERRRRKPLTSPFCVAAHELRHMKQRSTPDEEVRMVVYRMIVAFSADEGG